MGTALNTFIGDREFLRAPACCDQYQAKAEELLPGRCVVAFVRQKESTGKDPAMTEPQTVEAWFHEGLALLRAARPRAAVFEACTRWMTRNIRTSLVNRSEWL
jgi:hypothetical protein